MAARFSTTLLVTAVAATSALLATPARAATDCGNAVVEAWDNGRLDSSFAPACYRKALQELPEDIRIYSSAQDDINRALIASLARRNAAQKTTQTGAVKGIVRKLSSTNSPPKSVRQEAAAAAADPSAGAVPLTVLISGVGALFLVGSAAISVVARRLRRMHRAS
jgi:hypothetical protein